LCGPVIVCVTSALISHVELVSTVPPENLSRVPLFSVVKVPPQSVERALIVTPAGIGRVKDSWLIGPGLTVLSTVMVNSVVLPTPTVSGESAISTTGGEATPAKEIDGTRRNPSDQVRKRDRVGLLGDSVCEFIEDRRSL